MSDNTVDVDTSTPTNALTGLRRGAFIGWNEVAQNELDFDFVSEAGPTWFLEAPVSSGHFYFVVISLSCTASVVSRMSDEVNPW